MILWWILIIIGIVLLVRWISDQRRTSKNGETPLEILKLRYARGEISKKEFDEMKKTIEH